MRGPVRSLGVADSNEAFQGFEEDQSMRTGDSTAFRIAGDTTASLYTTGGGVQPPPGFANGNMPVPAYHARSHTEFHNRVTQKRLNKRGVEVEQYGRFNGPTEDEVYRLSNIFILPIFHDHFYPHSVRVSTRRRPHDMFKGASTQDCLSEAEYADRYCMYKIRLSEAEYADRYCDGEVQNVERVFHPGLHSQNVARDEVSGAVMVLAICVFLFRGSSFAIGGGSRPQTSVKYFCPRPRTPTHRSYERTN